MHKHKASPAVFGYENVEHYIEHWEYNHTDGLKRLLKCVFIPEHNILMPYVCEFQDTKNPMVVVYQADQTLYRVLSALRHSQNCRNESVYHNVNTFYELHNEIYNSIFEKIVDNEGFYKGIVNVVSKDKEYSFRVHDEFYTENSINNL